jgi:hypothetical protein
MRLRLLKIIYHCYGGSHSSVIAAALHLKWIDKDRLPSEEEMMAIPYQSFIVQARSLPDFCLIHNRIGLPSKPKFFLNTFSRYLI